MSATTPIKIGLCTDSDLPAAFLAVSRGFANNAPFFDAYFPHHTTPTGQAEASARLLQWKHAEESMFFVKAYIDRGGSEHEHEHIVGLALWTLMTEAPSDDLDKVEDTQAVWRDEGDREYMRRLWREYVVPRSEAVRRAGERGIHVLELLGVDQEWQRKGAGSALVAWGTERADREGIDAIVEGTPEGLKCYHGGGFCTEIEVMKLDVGERFKDRRPPVLTFLRRKAVT